MENFINYLKQFGNIPPAVINELATLLKVKSLKKNEYFLEAGQYCTKIGFVTKGVFRIFFCDKESNEITRYFIAENDFLIDLYSFNNNIYTSCYFEALTDSELIVLDKPAFEKMAVNFKDWDKIIQRITEANLLEKLNNRSELVIQDAKTKYIQFMEKFPNLVNRIPLGYLASYLGIKQQSLSRIRKEIATK
jgi:CRP-like cAMP-binding protein